MNITIYPEFEYRQNYYNDVNNLIPILKKMYSPFYENKLIHYLLKTENPSIYTMRFCYFKQNFLIYICYTSFDQIEFDYYYRKQLLFKSLYTPRYDTLSSEEFNKKYYGYISKILNKHLKFILLKFNSVTNKIAYDKI